MTRPFLPSFAKQSQPPVPNRTSGWGEHEKGLDALAQFSKALDVPSVNVPAERIKSVPSPWARLLLFEQALYVDRHPVHNQIKGEWRGLLGAIALASYLKFREREADPVSVHLGQDKQGIMEFLNDMIPVEDAPSPWQRFALLKFGDALVGGTSPRTLVFTGIRRFESGRIPFQRDGRLTDPTEHYRAAKDSRSLAILLDWLIKVQERFGHMGSALTDYMGQGRDGPSRINQFRRAWTKWIEDTTAAAKSLQAPEPRPHTDIGTSRIAPSFPNDHPARTIFEQLGEAKVDRESENANPLAVRDHLAVAYPGSTGILMQSGHPYNGTLVLPGGMTREVLNGRFVLPTRREDVGATWPDLGALFEEKLIPVADASKDNVYALDSGDKRYLYPFKESILGPLTPDFLYAWTKIDGEAATGVRVRLEIPMTGELSLVHERTFAATNVFENVTTPIVAVWPDFEVDDWKRYFFSIKTRARRGDASLSLTPKEQPSPEDDFKDDTSGLRWGRLANLPRSWIGTFRDVHGILLTKPVERIGRTGATWDISIDFGSTHTRVFRRESGQRIPVEIPLLPRAKMLVGDDATLEHRFFIEPNDDRADTDAEPPSLVWLPLDRVLDRNPSVEAAKKTWLPADGVMYRGELSDALHLRGLRGDLKWHGGEARDLAPFRAYVSQLFLSIEAEAAARGATIASLITAYPSVLPEYLRQGQKLQWERLSTAFGVRLNPARSESDALTWYLDAVYGASSVGSLFAVDIGGSTSDLTVWQSGEPQFADSVRLAGDILGRALITDTPARLAILRALEMVFDMKYQWAEEEGEQEKNALLFNSLLRTVDPRALANGIFVYGGTGGPNSAGERVLAYLAYLFATISFLLGLVARNKRVCVPTYELRFAGKGSEFLHWLDCIGEKFDHAILCQQFFLAGLGPRDDGPEPKVAVFPPGDDAKQEVGKGLLLVPSSAKPPSTERITFVGESGLTGDDGPIAWTTKLDIATLKRIRAPKAPAPIGDLVLLNEFVHAFDAHPVTQRLANDLGLTPDKLDGILSQRIHGYLFGERSAWSAAQQPTANAANTLLEPFFIAEAKVLLEYITANHGLFPR